MTADADVTADRLLRSRWIRFDEGFCYERRERDPDESRRTREAETEPANAFRAVSQSSRLRELDRVEFPGGAKGTRVWARGDWGVVELMRLCK